MLFGCHIPQFGAKVDGPSVARFARRVDELGYDALWVSHHVVIPSDVRTPYPYSPSGEFGLAKAPNFHDALSLLAFAAAVTRRVRLGTAALNLAFVEPLATAKAIATLDVLSGGRTTVGVVAGWLKEEFAVMGIPYDTRVPRAEESLRVMLEAWSRDEPNFRGRFFNATGIKATPHPAQRPHPPILVGGHSPRAFRWAATYGTGWMAPGLPKTELARLIAGFKNAAETLGKDPATFEVSAGVALVMTDSPGPRERMPFTGAAEQLAEDVAEYTKMGVTSLRFSPSLRGEGPEPATMLEMAERFARDVIPLVS